MGFEARLRGESLVTRKKNVNSSVKAKPSPLKSKSKSPSRKSFLDQSPRRSKSGASATSETSFVSKSPLRLKEDNISEKPGYDTETAYISITGMKCASCVMLIEMKVKKNPGMQIWLTYIWRHRLIEILL